MMRSKPWWLPSLLLTLVLPLAASHSAVPTPHPDFADALWIAESSRGLKVALSDGRVLFEIPDTGRIEALIVNEEAAVLWAYGEGQLLSFDFGGRRLLTRPIASKRTPHARGPKRAHLALNPLDGSLWLGVGQRLYHFDPTGELLQEIELPIPSGPELRSHAHPAVGRLPAIAHRLRCLGTTGTTHRHRTFRPAPRSRLRRDARCPVGDTQGPASAPLCARGRRDPSRCAPERGAPATCPGQPGRGLDRGRKASLARRWPGKRATQAQALCRDRKGRHHDQGALPSAPDKKTSSPLRQEYWNQNVVDQAGAGRVRYRQRRPPHKLDGPGNRPRRKEGAPLSGHVSQPQRAHLPRPSSIACR